MSSILGFLAASVITIFFFDLTNNCTRYQSIRNLISKTKTSIRCLIRYNESLFLVPLSLLLQECVSVLDSSLGCQYQQFPIMLS